MEAEDFVDGEIIAGLPAVSVPVVIPAIPPRPVWDHHLETLRGQVGEFRCETEEDFNRGKVLGNMVVKLKKQMQSGYDEVTQAIDAIKAPVLDQKKKDLAEIDALQKAVDGPSVAWLREEKRKADEEAERQRQADLARQKAKQAEEAELARAWGNNEEAEEIENRPIVAPRPSTSAPAFTYRAGARINPKPKARIVDPSKVGRAYCQPQLPLINARVASHFASIKNPTADQLKALADEIGGVVIEME